MLIGVGRMGLPARTMAVIEQYAALLGLIAVEEKRIAIDLAKLIR